MKFTDLLDEKRIPYKQAGEHHHTTPGWISLDCPFCSKWSGKYRLGFNLEHGYTSCWTCGYHSLVSVVEEILSVGSTQAKDLLKTMSLSRFKREDKPRGNLKLPEGIGLLHQSHQAYLKDRKFDPDELVRLWGIKGISIATRLNWRVWIPVYKDNEIYSWTTRGITNKEPRYINARPSEERISMKRMLYGEDYCNHSVIVHEGCTDVWRTGPGAVALMGVVYTRTQLERLSRFPLRVICFDNESDAQRRATKICNDLSVFPGKTINVILNAKDAASASPQEITLLRRMLG